VPRRELVAKNISTTCTFVTWKRSLSPESDVCHLKATTFVTWKRQRLSPESDNVCHLKATKLTQNCVCSSIRWSIHFSVVFKTPENLNAGFRFESGMFHSNVVYKFVDIFRSIQIIGLIFTSSMSMVMVIGEACRCRFFDFLSIEEHGRRNKDMGCPELPLFFKVPRYLPHYLNCIFVRCKVHYL